jgi:hypothetical protein
MKANARPDPGDGPERDELRTALRHWRAPAAPPGIEADLRREFRLRRRSRGRARVLWLSLAAGLTLVVAWPLLTPDVPSPSPSAPAPFAGASAPLVQMAEPDRVTGSSSVATDEGRARRRPTRAPKEPEVIVEPAQAELLAELGRQLSGTRQAIPGTAIPQMPEVEVPRYLDEWQTVAGEWPVVQESDAIGGR